MKKNIYSVLLCATLLIVPNLFSMDGDTSQQPFLPLSSVQLPGTPQGQSLCSRFLTRLRGMFGHSSNENEVQLLRLEQQPMPEIPLLPLAVTEVPASHSVCSRVSSCARGVRNWVCRRSSSQPNQDFDESLLVTPQQQPEEVQLLVIPADQQPALDVELERLAALAASSSSSESSSAGSSSSSGSGVSEDCDEEQPSCCRRIFNCKNLVRALDVSSFAALSILLGRFFGSDFLSLFARQGMGESLARNTKQFRLSCLNCCIKSKVAAQILRDLLVLVLKSGVTIGVGFAIGKLESYLWKSQHWDTGLAFAFELALLAYLRDFYANVKNTLKESKVKKS